LFPNGLIRVNNAKFAGKILLICTNYQAVGMHFWRNFFDPTHTIAKRAKGALWLSEIIVGRREER
jgi:hypothetical protein